jgi:hypothetical protein
MTRIGIKKLFWGAAVFGGLTVKVVERATTRTWTLGPTNFLLASIHVSKNKHKIERIGVNP